MLDGTTFMYLSRIHQEEVNRYLKERVLEREALEGANWSLRGRKGAVAQMQSTVTPAAQVAADYACCAA